MLQKGQQPPRRRNVPTLAMPAAPGDMRGAGVPSRSVYIRNFPGKFNISEVFKKANEFGMLESVKWLPQRNAAFVNFLEPYSAHHFLIGKLTAL